MIRNVKKHDVVQSRSLLTMSFHLGELERVPAIEGFPSTIGVTWHTFASIHTIQITIMASIKPQTTFKPNSAIWAPIDRCHCLLLRTSFHCGTQENFLHFHCGLWLGGCILRQHLLPWMCTLHICYLCCKMSYPLVTYCWPLSISVSSQTLASALRLDCRNPLHRHSSCAKSWQTHPFSVETRSILHCQCSCRSMLEMTFHCQDSECRFHFYDILSHMHPCSPYTQL